MRLMGFVVVAVFVVVDARGPHHPRGEKIAKHHVHYRPTKGMTDENIVHDTTLIHDKEHLQEHLEESMDVPDLSKLTNEELDFYYFQVHDTDKNSKLDGLEILQALLHTSHRDDDSRSPAEINDEFVYFTDLIDKALIDNDLDRDGYLSYVEFSAVRKQSGKTQAIPAIGIQPSVENV